MRWIDTTALCNWARSRDCQEHLPLLIRHLIRATAIDISHIALPAGDSVIYPGWDVILNVSEGTEYLPECLSVWEIGTNNNFKKKANEDYQKRKENPLEVMPSEATFIFVTPHSWKHKNDWCKEKKKEGFWKDIRVYDAETLEEWLEQAPAVGAWLARHLNIYTKGVRSLEDWWNDWSTITNPPLTSKLVLAGRDNQVDSVQKWLNSSPTPIAVQTDSSYEALAFLAAVINSLPEPEKAFYLSRSIVVDNSESFRHITVTGRTGLLIIPLFEEKEESSLAVQKEHHVYVPLGPENKVTTYKIVLTRLGRDEFISAIKEMELSEEDARIYSRDTGRSLTVLRRRLMCMSNQPEWAKAASARDIIPALLAGRWIESKDADKEIISQLSSEIYNSFSTKLSTWQHKSDSPILKIGELWRLVSPMDAWFALASFLTDADLHQFKSAILKVLGTINPSLELEPEKRWMASVYGKETPYSGTLREGLAQTLVLIAVFGETAKIKTLIITQTWVDIIVQELFKDADWKLWHSLSDVLTLIAEASPSSFLEAVESTLTQDEPPVLGMFSETDDTFTSSSAHPYLLWALECLAWSPKLLGRVTLILGKLVQLDPGGTIVNRPANTMRNIFLLWRPHTYSSMEKRFEAIDTLLEREPEVGLKLLIALMPRDHDSCIPTNKTRWRQFSEKTENPITIAEFYKSMKAINERLFLRLNTDGKLWAAMFEKVPALPQEERKRIIKQLSSCADRISENRSEVWNKLRKILSHHRTFPDADWSLFEEELKEIEKIYSILEPQDIIECYRWLFDEHRPDLPEGKEIEDYKMIEQLIDQRRKEAILVIKRESGLMGLISLSEKTINPSLVGIAVAEVEMKPEEEQELFSLLEGQDKNKITFIQGYIFQQVLKKKEQWIKNLVEMARTQKWTVSKIVNLFVSFPHSRNLWNLLESFDEEVQEGYWSQCVLRFLLEITEEDKIYALKQLLKVKRHFAALDIVVLFVNEIPTDLIAELLHKAATEKSEEDFHIQHYDIEKLFETLDKSSEIKEEMIAQLEWLYLPILARLGSGRPPKMLHSALSNNPEFFADVIKYIYKPKNDDMKDDDVILPLELIKQRAGLSWELLHSWKNVPGRDSNSKINYEELKKWVVKSRKLCKSSDREESGDSCIGQVLAYVESEEEGVWPPEAVCRIIDEIKSNELDTGFRTGIYKKRGIVTKSFLSGGQQEIVLAKNFRHYADNFAIVYPRTSAILTKIAEDYENEAKQKDIEAEKRDLEY